MIKRQIRVRQQIADIEEFVDDQGIRRCHLHLDPELVLTRLQARRPFQGWRYLEKKDSPEDIKKFNVNNFDDENKIVSELHDLGLV